MSKQNNGTSQKREQEEAADRASSEFHHADIEARAYKLWVARGRPTESADEDWFLAAKQLRETHQ